MAFLVQQMLGKIQTVTLVRIESCTNSGGLSDVGFVDVKPMVNQVDGQGLPTPHATIYGIPYLRIQGGRNAVIIDPEPGDIGICVFANRDISRIKATRAPGSPGSLRQFSFSDGMYLGGILNGIPSQYVQFSSAGIKIVSPTAVLLEAPTVDINASEACTITTPTFTVNGESVFNGHVDMPNGAAINGREFLDHAHGNVQPGSGQSGDVV